MPDRPYGNACFGAVGISLNIRLRDGLSDGEVKCSQVEHLLLVLVQSLRVMIVSVELLPCTSRTVGMGDGYGADSKGKMGSHLMVSFAVLRSPRHLGIIDKQTEMVYN